jgi:hypothetical protein
LNSRTLESENPAATVRTPPSYARQQHACRVLVSVKNAHEGSSEGPTSARASMSWNVASRSASVNGSSGIWLCV